MNGVSTEYVYDGMYITGESVDGVNYTYSRGTDLLGYTSSLGETVYYRTNVHGDVKELVNVFGESLERYDYNAYGAEDEDYNPFRRMFGKKSVHNPFRYTGEYTDSETGLVYLRNRMYDPETGRFTTEDTHWNISNMIYGDDSNNGVPNINAIMQNSNRYIYCGSNPINRYDSSGDNWITNKLGEAWNEVKWAFKTVGNYANKAQKIAQRTFWKTGSQLILRDYYGYETAACLLENCLQDNPGNVYRDSNSRIAGLISNSDALNSLIDSSIANSMDGTFSFDGSTGFSSGELFYSINKASVTYTGIQQNDGSWLITGTVTDVYDYTEIVSMMNSEGGYELKMSLGTAANDIAVISQKRELLNNKILL